MTNTSQPNVIVEMFKWWNEAFKDPNGFTAEAFARFYTEDGALYANSNFRARGPQALADHYSRIQANYPRLAMKLPVDAEFSTDTHAFVHCWELMWDDKGEATKRECMAYATLVDGKMSELRVVGLDAVPA